MKHQPQRIDIDRHCARSLAVRSLLRSHEMQRARDPDATAVPTGRGIFLMQPRQAEIHDLRHAVRVHDHVGRLQVPMDHPVFMQESHAAHHAMEQLQFPLQRQVRVLIQPLVQGPAVDPLHGQPLPAVGGRDGPEQQHQVRMDELGKNAEFPLQQLLRGPSDTVTMEDFKRHRATGFKLVRQPDFTRRPRAKAADDLKARHLRRTVAACRGHPAAALHGRFQHPGLPCRRLLPGKSRYIRSGMICRLGFGALHSHKICARIASDQPALRQPLALVWGRRLRVDG